MAELHNIYAYMHLLIITHIMYQVGSDTLNLNLFCDVKVHMFPAFSRRKACNVKINMQTTLSTFIKACYHLCDFIFKSYEHVEMEPYPLYIYIQDNIGV